MRFELNGKVATITLSKRNLLTMLAKVDDKDSAKTLVKVEQKGCKLILQVEDDVTHYHNRPEGGPGEIHPAHDPNLRNQS